MPKLTAVYQNFTGGAIDSAMPLLPDNCLVQAQNVVLGKQGGFTARKGTVNFNSTSYGAVNVTELIEWPRKDGSKVLLAMVGNTLAKINEDGTKTDLKALDNNQIGWFFLQDKFYFTGKEGGTDKYWYYDGSTVAEVIPNGAGDNDLEPIKRCRLFVWHSKSYRIFAAKDPNDLSCLYYSEPNDPTYFKNTSKLYPTTGDGPVTALALFGEGLLVFYQNSIWAYKGSDPSTDATWSKLPVAVGTVSPKSIAHAPGYLLFLGNDGIYALSPGILEYNVILIAGEGLIVNLAENKQQETIRSILYPESAAGVFFDGKYHLAYSYDSDQYKKKILVLDWSLKAFVSYTSWHALAWCSRSNGDLLFGTTGGHIVKCFQGYNDRGQDIQVKVVTKKYDLATGHYVPSRGGVGPYHIKKLKRFFIGVKSEVTSPEIDVTIKTDMVTTNQSISITAAGWLVWGQDWGNKWGFPDSTVKEARFSGLKSRTYQVEISYTTNTSSVTILGIGFEFKAKKPRGDK